MGRFVNQLLSRFFQLNVVKQYWANKYQSLSFENSPWMPLKKPLNQSKVAIISTGGIHLKEDRPFDMSNKEGDPTYRKFPHDIDPADLMITHDYYDHSDADKDINIVLPFKTAIAFRDEGILGALSSQFYSFMGHIEGRQISKLIGSHVDQLLSELLEEQVDVAIFSPA